MVPCADVRQRPKLHLDRLSRFCMARFRDQQTDTETHRDRPRYSVCSSSPHLMQRMQCSLHVIVIIITSGQRIFTRSRIVGLGRFACGKVNVIPASWEQYS